MDVKSVIIKLSCIWRVLRPLSRLIFTIKTRDILSHKAKIENKGYGSIRKYILGRNNSVFVGEGTSMSSPLIRIVGTGNKLIIGQQCKIGPGCEFWLEGNNVTITIGKNTSFTNDVEVNAQEDGSSISIGEDCMISNHIIIRTSDSHPIFDIDSGKRINLAKSVSIGSHVWIAPHSTIMKGTSIMDGAIIGSNTIVTKDVPSNSLAVGMPARVVKHNIKWTKEQIF